jgi:hypothetical protein
VPRRQQQLPPDNLQHQNLHPLPQQQVWPDLAERIPAQELYIQPVPENWPYIHQDEAANQHGALDRALDYLLAPPQAPQAPQAQQARRENREFTPDLWNEVQILILELSELKKKLIEKGVI